MGSRHEDSPPEFNGSRSSVSPPTLITPALETPSSGLSLIALGRQPIPLVLVITSMATPARILATCFRGMLNFWLHPTVSRINKLYIIPSPSFLNIQTPLLKPRTDHLYYFASSIIFPNSCFPITMKTIAPTNKKSAHFNSPSVFLLLLMLLAISRIFAHQGQPQIFEF